MTWISHVGRKSGLIQAPVAEVRAAMDDAQKASVLVRGHLDLASSSLDVTPPVWALKAIGVAGVHARPAVAVRVESGPDGLLLRTAPVESFDPTRLTADLDLIDEADVCRLVARWDAAVDLGIPRLAKRPAGVVVGQIINRLVDELLEQLRTVTR